MVERQTRQVQALVLPPERESSNLSSDTLDAWPSGYGSALLMRTGATLRRFESSRVRSKRARLVAYGAAPEMRLG